MGDCSRAQERKHIEPKTRCRYDEAVFSVNYVTDQQEFVADDCAEASTCDAEQQLEYNVWLDAC